MAFIVSLLAGFLPMLFFAGFLYWLDRYEKEPKILVGIVFIWGAVFAAAAAFITNSILGVGIFFFTNSEAATNLASGSIIAPLVEESLKAFAVLVIFVIYRREFDSILDGILYAGVAALGFAATENVYYIYTMGYQQSGWQGLWELIFIRVVVVAWQHPFYTAFIGIGLAVARLSPNGFVRFLAPILGWCAAVFTHAFHNTMAGLGSGLLCFAGTFLDWTGWIMMFLFILWNIGRERELLKKYLEDEVGLNILTAEQYQTAISTVMQSAVKFGSLFSGHYQNTKRFYNLCAELAHKKHQVERLGDEDGNNDRINNLRQEISGLSRQLLTQ